MYTKKERERDPVEAPPQRAERRRGVPHPQAVPHQDQPGPPTPA